MKRKTALVGAVAALAAAALIPAGLASHSSGPSVSSTRSKLGRILVDRRGHSLYLFEKDGRGRSSCYGACAANWPPLIASAKPRATGGTRASLLGRTKRRDGRWQVTYKRHPLYRYAGDTSRGQTNGEGLEAYGAEWYLVSPAGAKVEVDASSNSGAGGGYGGYGG